MPAHTTLRIAVLLSALLLCMLLLASCGAGEHSDRHVIEVSGFAFVPDTLHIAVGDTVVWLNRDVVPHTATERSGGWDSGSLGAGASWAHVAEQAGEMQYVCTLHPTMTGLIVIR